MTPRLPHLHDAAVTADPILASIEATGERARELREQLQAAEREHHDLIVEAATARKITVSAIARAAGVGRTRIYKHLAQPVYGDRSATA